MEGLLYDGNLEQLNANLDSFFANPDMVSISIREFQGDIAIARERHPDNGSGETLRSRVVIKRGLDELGEVTTAYSTARIEQHLQTSRNEILLFTTILALVLSLVIYYVAKGLTRPIERLTEAARDMANGHLDREIAVAGTYELQSLGDSFIRMRDAIREKMADLAAQNANLRVKDRAIASSLNGLTIADPDGRLIYVNPSFLRLWGYDDPSEVLGKSAVDFWQQPSQAAGAIESLRLNGSFSGEMTAKKKDGTLFPVEISASLMDDEQGRPSCLVESFLDITERKRAEEEQRKLASVVEMSRDMIGIASMDGRVIYMNAAGLCLVGLAGIEAARAAVVLDFFPESSSQQAHEEIMPTLLENNFWQGETRLRNFSTGKEIDVEMAIFLIKDSQGTPFAMATVTRDISERKAAEKNREHLEAQFMQAQKMESVGRLAGGVAHDFNNMLSVILGYTELMKGVLPETNPPMHYLQEIEGAALRSRDLTRQLLAFSRKQAIAPKVVNLNILIEGMQKTLTRMIGEDIDLRFSPVEDLWNITIDPMQVDQIIMNLAVNARDALPNGGTLTLETANLRLDEEYCRRNVDFLPGSYVVLMVSDNGIGMNNEILTHLFEPFFTTKEFGKGTGLG
ncbi:MAG: PAS domain S-box protein, partial [Desulfobulbaceae bacterium]|nr:PAS domain S-box protein [Desulfobulbaceae bacterium]